MKSEHRVFFENSQNMSSIPPESVDLVVTSPPYPMIEMWDDLFSEQNTDIANALGENDGLKAFELMHQDLDLVWKETWRVLKEGGFVCINIGDATRTVNGTFRLYPNHSRIISSMLKSGFNTLPEILWRKQTNAPNKFMGSGMLPAGAYVTLEHEHILVFRKGEKREFKKIDEKLNRRNSSYFWEERNVWFSDVWTDLKGTVQKLSDNNVRKRSAAYPVEIPYRLINMFSVKGDTVLDPFLGIGTTTYAAIAAGRNSVGYELNEGFSELIFSGTDNIVSYAEELVEKRLQSHMAFVEERLNKGKEFKHVNEYYKFPVVTKQETELLLNRLVSAKKIGNNKIEAVYSESPQSGVSFEPESSAGVSNSKSQNKKTKKNSQMTLSF